MRNTYKIFILVNVFLTHALISRPQDKFDAIDSLITRSNRLGLFNGNVLVVDHGKEIYREAIGCADASGQIRLTDQYRFHIGSIAKELNECAIMMLKEQGKLSLEEAIIIFKYNTTLFPKSGNAFDSLAEACLNKGDKTNALLNYKRAVELDPANSSAKEKIAALTAR